VVLGGPQVTAIPFRAKKHADAVVVGEGELLWPQVVNDAQEGTLRDFYVCSPLKFNPKGHSLFYINHYVDLTKSPNPLRKIYKKKYAFDTVFAVRGCPVNCDFCYVTSMFGKEFRVRPVEDVVAEVDTFKNFYYLLDDSVFGKPKTYNYYLKLYEAIAQLKKKRYWTGQANLDAAASEKGRRVIEAAARSGLLYAAIGMESINPATLKKCGAINKMGVSTASTGNNVIAEMKKNIRFIQDTGIIVSGWFVIGYDDDDLDTYYRTLDFCIETNILPVIYPIRALPGTRLYERLEREGKLDDNYFINYRNPNIKDSDAFKALSFIKKEGYSLKQCLRRTGFYHSKFKQTTRDHYSLNYKTVFTYILQRKLKNGLDISKIDM
jgi:radical SAM superfamily enzyme YgiQ (UPF0313 family)